MYVYICILTLLTTSLPQWSNLPFRLTFIMYKNITLNVIYTFSFLFTSLFYLLLCTSTSRKLPSSGDPAQPQIQ